MRGIVWSVCALAVMAGAAGAVGLFSKTADPEVHLAVNGVARSYLIHVPSGTAPAGGYPLILAFHGGGGQGHGMLRLTGFDAIADKRGFIVIYPNGIDKHWNDGRSTIKNKIDDVAFVNAVLDDVGRRYSVNHARVFATGMSNGALFVQRLGCELSARIAAIAPVAGPIPAEIAPTCHPQRPVSVLQIEGTSDPIMPYAGGKVYSFAGLGEGGNVLSTEKTMALWARLDGCSGPSQSENLPPQSTSDTTRIARQRFTGCRNGSQVELLNVEGGGHTWPGGMQYAPRFIIGKTSGQIDASETIVDFFLGNS